MFSYAEHAYKICPNRISKQVSGNHSPPPKPEKKILIENPNAMLGRCGKPALTWGRQQEPLLLQDAESELWAERPELIGQQCHKALSEIWPTQHTVQ